MKLLSIILLLLSVSVNLKHGWDAFQPASAEQAKVMANLGITENTIPVIGLFSIITGLLLLFPKTFFIGNAFNALSILMIMMLSLKADDIRTAMIEIPFLIVPLVMIWLKYPFKN